MRPLDFDKLREFVNVNIADFHQRRIFTLENLQLNRLLSKNPYLFRAKNIVTAAELMEDLLDAFLSSSEEKLFGDFLERLAIYTAEQTCDGHKSAAQGIDLEFINREVHYVVSIKSGPNWGNSSQHRRLAQDLRDAVNRIKQGRTRYVVEPVLGICYGKTRTSHTANGYLKVVGQNFWYLISENKSLYVDIVEPIGHRAKYHNEAFHAERAKVVNRFTKDFLDGFCESSGAIDWAKVVHHNSGNYDLDRFQLP